MKINKTIYPLGLKKFTSIFCLLILFLATACEQQSVGVEQGGQTIDINLNIFLGLKAVPDDGTEQERKVTSLRVYAFHANGYLDKMEYVQRATGLTGNPYVMDMTVFSGQKTFCLVANEPSRLTSALSDVKSQLELQALTMQTSDITFGDPSQVLLPMTSTTSVTITPNQTAPVSLSLERAVAKVEMTFIKIPTIRM
ncbi:MAG TPA: fimbrial protein [Bacteroides reticulotermitis]|nr:fimbrial protein [Bacteroides reticulotermitis]